MINKIIVMGRLTKDPELRQTTSGISCCNFDVAVTRKTKDKDGNYQADFIRCQAWRQSAEFVSKYFSKGKMIIVEGSLRNNDYTDQNGVKHYGMSVLADSVAFGESKGGGTAQASVQGNTATTTAQTSGAAAESAIPGELGDLSEFAVLGGGDVPF